MFLVKYHVLFTTNEAQFYLRLCASTLSQDPTLIVSFVSIFRLRSNRKLRTSTNEFECSRPCSNIQQSISTIESSQQSHIWPATYSFLLCVNEALWQALIRFPVPYGHRSHKHMTARHPLSISLSMTLCRPPLPRRIVALPVESSLQSFATGATNTWTAIYLPSISAVDLSPMILRRPLPCLVTSELCQWSHHCRALPREPQTHGQYAIRPRSLSR